MGSVGIGLVQDGVFVFFNLGGMVFFDKNFVNFGVIVMIVNGIFIDKNMNEIVKIILLVSLLFVGYVVYGVGKEKKVKIGFGVYILFGFIIFWENGWMGCFVMIKL